MVLTELISHLNRHHSAKNISRYNYYKLIFLNKWITKRYKMKITIIGTFVLFALACNFAVSSAYPNSYSIDKFDGDVTGLEETDNDYDYKNSRLRRSYYDDDYYYGYYPSYQSYSAPIRREDTDIDRAYKYTPLVRYKSTRTKRKKLFVPNLWG